MKTDGNSFRRVGDYWEIEFEGRTITMRDAKGLHHLSRLLAAPGCELHVLDLIGASGGGDVPAGAARTADSVRADLGDAGEMLDPQAKAEYRGRLERLKSELEEAESASDTARAAKLREEIDFLSQELSAAFGLRGRARKAGDAAERARKAVSGRVSETITRMRQEHPALAEHLSSAVKLGTFCEYRPENATHWEI